MTRFEWCVERVLHIETEELTDDPDDPGGLTKFGISQHAHPDVDIVNLTRESAIELYRRRYWEPVRAELLPLPLDYYVFDCAVNQGVDRAARTLQRVVRVPIDGIIGPTTIGAAWNAPRAETAARYLTKRALHYAALPTFPKYGEGWFKRLFLVAAA